MSVEFIYCVLNDKPGRWSPYDANSHYGVFTETYGLTGGDWSESDPQQVFDVSFESLSLQCVSRSETFVNCLYDGVQGVWLHRLGGPKGRFKSLRAGVDIYDIPRVKVQAITWSSTPGRRWDIEEFPGEEVQLVDYYGLKAFWHPDMSDGKARRGGTLKFLGNQELHVYKDQFTVIGMRGTYNGRKGFWTPAPNYFMADEGVHNGYFVTLEGEIIDQVYRHECSLGVEL
jgi:hypothetical protein